MRQLLDRSPRRGRRISLTGMLILVVALVGAPAALANTTKSTNWAGYAIHRAGVAFSQVSGTWIQPGASCVKGRPSYSAVWVGLGGYKGTSQALEQIGTEIDCTGAGKVVSSAWFELVPAPSKPISLAVAPGDLIRASVSVTGHRVAVELDDLTQHQVFRKVLDDPSIDVSSAEWIVEAPSECISQFSCQALPLANFGTVTFESATVTANIGKTGTIADSRWARTKVKLTAGGQRFVVARHTSDSAGTAAPSSLRSGGSVFDVTYAAAAAPPAQAFAREARLSAGHLQH